METSKNLYPNIVNFLTSNGLTIKLLEKDKIEVEFSDKEIDKTFVNFFEIRKEAELANEEGNFEKSDALFNKSWKILNKTEKEFYPKLEPILVLLNKFYAKSNTPLEFMLIFENPDLRFLSLGGNPLFYDMYPDKDLFTQNIVNELHNLDKFLEIS
jgi:hypothetical protein